MVEPFDPTGPLPTGTTVLEASAGTGKTYTIEALVARYVADGWPLRKLLVVTFTRMATAELRDRVRARLVGVADHLDAHLAGARRATDDEVAELLARGGDDAVRQRYDHIVAALSEFDAATISTIHGFCQQVLAGLGLTGDVDRQVTLIEDQRDLIDAVVDDVLVRTYAGGGHDHERLKKYQVDAIVRPLMSNSGITILPATSQDPQVLARRRLAHDVVAEIDQRKRLGGVLSYDDLLTRLRATLLDPERGAAARDRLRMQYDIALIDEFQDTDPIQWDILRHVFGDDGAQAASPSRALVLIGDPKQAIYAFRGADVYAYLDAITRARQATLTTNWRSDQPLLVAYNRLFAGATLGHDKIAYRDVSAPDKHAQRRLIGDVGAPLRLRLVNRTAAARKNKKGTFYADAARELVARDAAGQIVALLESGAELVSDYGAVRQVRPEDIAVLARTNAEAALMQRILRDAKVPAVINGVGSVFATAAAVDWLRLLEALEQPASGSRARAAALTVFIGKSAEWVAHSLDEDAALETVHDLLRSWAGVLRERSVASLLQTITLQQDLPARLLSRSDGERMLTDVEHIGELLHAAAIAEELGISALGGWLRDRIAEAPEDVEAEDRARRLESDAEAVQVLTIHRSKGLEFPVVLCPFLWSSGRPETTVPIFHDPDSGNVRSINVGGHTAPDYEVHKKQAERELRGEQLRLVYVALTRAKHQAIVWWIPADTSNNSPLARLLFCRTANGDANPLCEKVTSVPDDDVAARRLGQLAERSEGTMAIEVTPDSPPGVEWTGRPTTGADLAAAKFTRTLDGRWRRNSYSGITAGGRDGERVGSEPGEDVKDDEHVAPAAALGAAADGEQEATLRAIGLPLATMRGGTEVGTFVHAVFEHVDFASDDLHGEVSDAIEEQSARRLTALGDVDIVGGLCRAIETPLGPLAGDLRLRDLTRQDRLDELTFELPLAGGLDPSGSVAVRSIARLLRRHLADDDPVTPYATTLADAPFAVDLRGYLTGSIDLVLRLPGDRFAVADYKTNWLGSPDETLTAWHYRPTALVGAMEHGHYPLQALLYSAALHRFLRWRLPGYSPERHLGGVLYLFVRGMTGDDVPRVGGDPCGVFAWTPPPELIADLSDLLAGREVAA